MHVLRKSYGPLSGGTPVEIVSSDEEGGTVSVRLANVSRMLRVHVEASDWEHVLDVFPIPAGDVVNRREKKRKPGLFDYSRGGRP